MTASEKASGSFAGRDRGAPVQVAPSNRRLIDVVAFAAKLDCDERTIYRLADSGKAPYGVKLGALRRWDETEIDNWIASGCQPKDEMRGGKP